MQIQRLANLAAFAVEEAKRLGATEADVGINASRSSTVAVRFKQVEELKGSEPRSMSIRTFVGKNSANTTTSDFRRRALTRLIRDTVEMARRSAPDETAGLPDKSDLAIEFPDLDLTCEELEKLSAQDKIAMSLSAEEAAYATDSRITNARSIGFSDATSFWVHANSLGFVGGYGRSHCQIHATVIASQGEEMQLGSWSDASRKLDRLATPESVGRRAAERALRLLGARKVSSQTVPVVFDPQTAATLLRQFVSAADGAAIYRRRSFLLDKIGQAVAASRLNITDDPFLQGALGSRPFGSSGLAIAKRTIVRHGELSSYLLDHYEARKLGVRPNGGSSTNLFIEAGDSLPEQIIASVKNGLYLTRLSGNGFNVVTGDYSMGAAGMWIENGQLAYPVHEITVAGNMLEMFKSIEAVGNDLEFRSSTCAPTLLVGALTVAGK